MYRRTFFTGLAVGAAGLAGCGGSSEAELLVPEFTFEAAEDGDTVVVLTVENPGQSSRQVRMVTTVEGEDGERVSAATPVELDAGETATYRVPVDVPWSWFDDNRNLRSVEFEDR